MTRPHAHVEEVSDSRFFFGDTRGPKKPLKLDADEGSSSASEQLTSPFGAAPLPKTGRRASRRRAEGRARGARTPHAQQPLARRESPEVDSPGEGREGGGLNPS